MRSRWLSSMVVMGLVALAGPTAGQEFTHARLGLMPVVPLEKMADVIIVIRPQEKYSLHRAATVDRMVQGQIMRVEKGVVPQMIVHTRNTLTSPLEAGVPVMLFLKEFKDGRAHYIIGVGPESYKGQP
jgi:hypothetical protein